MNYDIQIIKGEFYTFDFYDSKLHVLDFENNHFVFPLKIFLKKFNYSFDKYSHKEITSQINKDFNKQIYYSNLMQKMKMNQIKSIKIIFLKI